MKKFEKHFMAQQHMPKIFYDPHKNPPSPLPLSPPVQHTNLYIP